jgi:hypothetical protein
MREREQPHPQPLSNREGSCTLIPPQGGNAIQYNKPPFRKKCGLKNKKLIRRFPASLIERGVIQNKKPPFRKKGGFKI